MLLITWTGCADYEVDNIINSMIADRVNLALNVSTVRNSTRMADNVTQVNYATHTAREIQDLKLFPYDVQGVIGDDKTALSGMQYDVNEVASSNYYRHYFDDRSAKIPNGTASFLCYAKATPVSESGSVTEMSDFMNGVLEPSGLTASEPNTDDITFTPKVIHNPVTVSDEATAIAKYLTDIADAIKAVNTELFYEFINDGRLVACSSTNVPKLAAWVTDNDNSVNLSGLTAPSNSYPSDIYLPDGAAAVKWNGTTKKFEPQPVTTTEANINSLNRFIYPAELWYYANSRIKTSKVSRKDYYTDVDWATVLAEYDPGDGVMGPSVHSVAIKDPLSYAVGCLQIGLVVSESLTDADAGHPTTITLSKSTEATGDTPATVGTFPLTAVFVSGQYTQKFDFTPKTTTEEMIIYDPEITGITMGDNQSPVPSMETASKFVNTLVLQTQDGVSVRFALEFENNSNNDFRGADGIIFKGTKFYLVGTIDVTGGQSEDYKNRAFTKNYITQGTVRISSLKQAYPYLPDLLDPRLEIAIKLVPNWIQSTTTNVSL